MGVASERPLRRGEGAVMRELILDAADDLLRSRGDVARVSIREIADRVHRTQPTIYAHFPDKQALVLAVCERTFARLGTSMDAATAGEVDAESRLTIRARTYVEFAVAHPEHYRMLMMTDLIGGTGPAIDRLSGYTGFAGLIADLELVATSGRWAVDDVQLTALALLSAVHGVASLLVAHPTLTWPPDLLDEVLRAWAGGMQPR